MNKNQMYAIVKFQENSTFSEVPTNWLESSKNGVKCWWPTKIKNVTSSIANRYTPDKTTWDLCDIEIEQFCDTWEKARKIAEDPTYKTTDDEQMGKGCRVKYDNRHSSSSESEISKNICAKNKNTKKKKHTKSLRKYPLELM
ncbi:PREDICTED: uncharacterized protein LOC105555808 [Vollenhovia emeryi]|uniref:uncharacterized protein LOC105555808 n=1 Tax=Vollenhovia emeryi TaxID=411798 RepID=UPI0005F4DB4E|nr:PREDICTED: uncharacterized protein LOC105555808 [Vollenhovia emeryi]